MHKISDVGLEFYQLLITTFLQRLITGTHYYASVCETCNQGTPHTDAMGRQQLTEDMPSDRSV